MAIIPVENLSSINGNPVDPQSLLFYWGPFQSGDEGSPVRVWAYPFCSWHFTGNPIGGDVNNLVPIPLGRSMTVLASNDHLCWGPVFKMIADPAGMAARTGDPMRSGYPGDGQFMFIKPIVGGPLNPQGPDCGLLLFCAKEVGPRT
jgi:hypothetical protein